MSLTKRILIGVLVFVLVAVIGLIAFIMYRLNIVSSKGNAAASSKELTYSAGEFTVNLDEPGYRRYIKVNIYFGFTEEKLQEELTEKTPQIRSEVNNILRSKKVEDVGYEKTGQVVNEIKDKVNGILTSGKVENVYFYDILIQ